MTTPDSRPTCLWRTLTLVTTASPFRIVLKKSLFHGHLSIRIMDSFRGLNSTQTILNDPNLADTFPQDCLLSTIAAVVNNLPLDYHCYS